MIRPALFRLNNTQVRDHAIATYFASQPPHLRSLALPWYRHLRACGDEVREILHDGHPTLCLGNAAFAYVAVLTAHVSLGFFQGSALADPANLLCGSGKFMRHIKLTPAAPTPHAAIENIIQSAWLDIQSRVISE